jgi:hypothetical protein
VALTSVFLPRPLSAWRAFIGLAKENTATLMWVRGVLDVLRHHMRADDGNRTRMTSVEVRSPGLRADLRESRSWSPGPTCP